MPSGKTLEMLEISRAARWRMPEPWQPKDRDRSLRGKARILARKVARRG